MTSVVRSTSVGTESISSSFSSGSDDSSSGEGESDLFGWFDNIPDAEEESSANNDVREAWVNLVSEISPRKSRRSKNPVSILYSWNNPNPSVSMKMSSAGKSRYGMNISSCVSGIRICQYQSGDIRAEFNLIFCYGSVSYCSWKSYSEFSNLAQIVEHMHEHVHPIFPDTMKCWKLVVAKKRWFRCLNVLYLIEKSILLGRFIENLLHESPSPGLLLCFVQNPFMYSLSSW